MQVSEANNSKRQQLLYWRELEQLKAASIYMRLYRNELGWWVRGVEIIKVIGSSGGIAGWVVWKDYPLVWSAIIAGSQLLDALKNVFPFAKQHKAASDLTVALELLWIDAEEEWETIYADKISEEVITKRRTKLRKLRLETERKYFPEGFTPSDRLFRLATQEARDYFALTYTDEAQQ
ncbi:hypothetical protein [Methylobacterium nonmethylotrophicum]|uniref:SMODS and SLOG-associating 2TM effector domain-containing protein n=1 Tax=Methylobacterium nonmethylotrophicum TaxID=1141884 RepID=A0A4Z0NC57_9HYPH|nr:hypothetical protein [Methylobacterium nonmethylotrophicum]TGD91917.1 hypothetical protein EU555_35415 [Methylobacterium nonmethylotrophicum]